jgi:hypothetical protein
MTNVLANDRLISDWLGADVGTLDAERVDVALAAARRRPQRRGLVALLAGSGSWPAHRTIRLSKVPPALRIAVALALAAVLVVGGLLAAGVRLPTPVLPPPSPASDGRLLAVVRNGGLFFAKSDGTEQRLVLSGDFIDVAWSPDGSRLAVAMGSARASGGPGFVLLDSSGTVISEVPDVPAGLPMAWSDDGSRLLTPTVSPLDFKGGSGRLQLIGADGTVTESQLLPTVGDRLWRGALTIAWHGDWVALDMRRERALCYELVLLPTRDRSGEVPLLFNDGAAKGDCGRHQPAWSPAGAKLALLRAVNSCLPFENDPVCSAALAIQPVRAAGPPLPDGDPTILLDDANPLAQPMWMPGGQQLVVVRNDSTPAQSGTGGAAVSIVRADGSGMRSVASIDTADVMLRWAIPGRSVLYRTGAPSDFVNGNAIYAGTLHWLDLESGRDTVMATDVIAAAMQP